MDISQLMAYSATSTATTTSVAPIRGFEDVANTSFGGTSNGINIPNIANSGKVVQDLSNSEFLQVVGNSMIGGLTTNAVDIASKIGSELASSVIGNVIDSSISTIEGVVTDLSGKIVSNVISPIVDPIAGLANKVTDTITSYAEQAYELYEKVENAVMDTYDRGVEIYETAMGYYNTALSVVSIISPEAASLIDSKLRLEANNLVSSMAANLGISIPGLSGLGGMLGSLNTGYNRHYSLGTVRQRIGLKINNKAIPMMSIIHYNEIYDYRSSYGPVRVFGLSVPIELYKEISEGGTAKDVKVDIAYAYQTRLGQDVGWKSSDDIADYIVYRTIQDNIGRLGEPRNKITEKEQKTTDKDAPTDINMQSVFLEISVFPKEILRKKNSVQLTSAIIDGSNITTLICSGFQKYFGEEIPLVLAPLHNNPPLTKYGIKPKTFPALLNFLQHNYNVYNGGMNLYVDDNVYIINKNGPLELELQDQWTYEIMVREEVFSEMDEIYETNVAAKKGRLVINKQNIQQATFNVNKKINTNYYNAGGLGSLSGTDGISSLEQVQSVNHNKEVLPQLEDEYEIHSFTLKNFPVVFNIGDKIILKLGKYKFEGTVYKWASQYNKQARMVVLMVVSKKVDFETGDYLGGSFSFLDSNAILSAYKDKANAKIESVIAPYKETVDSYKSKLSASREALSSNIGTFAGSTLFRM